MSTGLATEPAWAPDGRAIYYRSDADTLVAAAIDFSGQTPRVTARTALFSTANYTRDDVDRAYTVPPDNERFIFVRQPPVATLVVVTDWFSEVKKIFGIEK